MLEINGNQKVAQEFSCVLCDYKTSKKSNYTKHLDTSKHLSSVYRKSNIVQKVAKVAKAVCEFSCNSCGIKYITNSGLWKHKRKCNLSKLVETDLEVNNIEETNDELDTSKKDNLIQYLLKENSDFKNLIMELVKKEYMNNSNNINNTTNNTTNNVNSNNSFNLNVFLNDTCKGAMNMSEFVNTIAIQMSDLENFAHMDYANGVSKILLKNLNNLETNQRPIHCTDLKRETVYIKENDCWTKETDEKQNLKKAIKQIAFKNIKHINEWVKENPGCQDPRTKQNVKYNKIVMNSMSGGTIEEQEDNIEKIVKNVTKAVTIDKYSLK
jgi:hypothetical protein